jgi:hypothetical protein
MGTAYVYRLSDTGVYKVGKTKNIEKRQTTYETIRPSRSTCMRRDRNGRPSRAREVHEA